MYIRVLRGLEDISQKRAGDRIGVASKTVERWEAGENEPPMTTLQRYVAALKGSGLRATVLLLGPHVDPETIESFAQRDWKNGALPAETEQQLIGQLASLTGKRRQTAIDLLQQLLAAEEHDAER